MPTPVKLDTAVLDPDRVSLLIGGRVHRDWNRYDIDSDLLTPADAWQVTLGLPDGQFPPQVTPGAPVEVRVGTDTVMSGRIDEIRHALARGQHRLEINGRDGAAILLDCSAPQFNGRRAALSEVLASLVRPLGITRIALRSPHDPAAQDAANRLLEQVRAQSGAEVIYLMNPAGLTLAASNWREADSFVGRNFAFRPYFRDALAGRPGQFFGLGTTSAKRGYFFAAAVRDGAAVLGSIQPQPIDAAPDGSLPLDKVAAKIKADDIHFARTRLLSLENTHNGKVLPREYLKAAWEFTRERGLGLHVDGARIFNAVVEYGCALKEITQYCDSFTICLSKGLGTPVGSLLVGNADYIKRANRWRKMTGGGMRQAGILAAAGLYALKNNVARLKDDHDNAAWMAAQLREIGADVMRHDTNMLFVRVGDDRAAALGEFMKSRGVLINASPVVRLVMHLDVNREQLADVVKHWQAFLQR